MDIVPAEVIHIGDHHTYDYETPIEVKLKALFLDRSGSRAGQEVVKGLTEAK